MTSLDTWVFQLFVVPLKSLEQKRGAQWQWNMSICSSCKLWQNLVPVPRGKCSVRHFGFFSWTNFCSHLLQNTVNSPKTLQYLQNQSLKAENGSFWSENAVDWNNLKVSKVLEPLTFVRVANWKHFEMISNILINLGLGFESSKLAVFELSREIPRLWGHRALCFPLFQRWLKVWEAEK